MKPISKSGLAIQLSKLKGFESPKAEAEQYLLEAEAAASVLWHAYMAGDVAGKVVADFGCGTGILGIGCLLLEAKRVLFVDSDERALKVAGENLLANGFSAKKSAEIICSDVADFSGNVDVIVQNPPFGTKRKHADKGFLEKAMETAPVIYSFHKLATRDFVEKISRERGFTAALIASFALPLKKSYGFHRKPVVRVEVGCWRMVKK